MGIGKIQVIGAIVGLAAMGGAWLDATAAVMHRVAPEAVLRIVSGDPRSLSQSIDRRTLRQTLASPSPEDARKLRVALLERPLSVSIVRQLAMAEDAFGRTPRSGELLQLSHRISRRDLLSELLLSERAHRARKPDEAMRHFNAALSSTTRANALLFPALGRTMSVPEFRPAIARYLGAPWAPAFLDYAVRSVNPGHLMMVVEANPAVQTDAKFRTFRGDLMARLIAEGRADLAISYAARGRREDQAPLATPGFSEATTSAHLGPLLWRFSAANGIFPALYGNAVVIDVEPGSTGRALTRVFALAPGTSVLAADSKIVDASDGMAADWTVECLARDGSRSIASASAPLEDSPRRKRLPIEVSASCQAVSIALDVRNPDDRNDAQIEVSNFTLKAGN